jgi:DNA-binding MarR family transcriptional regulator
MSRSGLRTTQYSLLSHVVKLGPLSPGDLARAMKMQPSTLTRNLQPLVAAGWVQVGAGVDGRSRSVTSTPEGRAKRSRGTASLEGRTTVAQQRLGPARVAALHRLVDECMDLLSEATQPESTGGAHV